MSEVYCTWDWASQETPLICSRRVAGGMAATLSSRTLNGGLRESERGRRKEWTVLKPGNFLFGFAGGAGPGCSGRFLRPDARQTHTQGADNKQNRCKQQPLQRKNSRWAAKRTGKAVELKRLGEGLALRRWQSKMRGEGLPTIADPSFSNSSTST